MTNEFYYLSPQAREKLLSSPLLQFASPKFKEHLNQVLEPLALDLRYANNWHDLFKLAFKASAYAGTLSIKQRPLNPGSGNYWDILRALERIPLTPELKEDLFVEAALDWNRFVQRISELSGVLPTPPKGVLSEVARDVDWDSLAEARSIHVHVTDQPLLPEEALLQAYQKLETMLSRNFLPIPLNHIVIGEYEGEAQKRKKIILFPVEARKVATGTGNKIIIDLPKVFLDMGWEYLGIVLDFVENPKPSEGVSVTHGTLYILGAVEADVEPIPVSRDKPLFGVSLSLGQGEIFSTFPKDLGTTFQRASHGWCGGALLSEDGLVGMILFAPRPLTAFPPYIPNDILAANVRLALKNNLKKVRNAPLLGIQ
jgi:hypothetical protein